MKGNTKKREFNWRDTLKEKTMASMMTKDKKRWRNSEGNWRKLQLDLCIFSSHSHSNILFTLFEKLSQE